MRNLTVIVIVFIFVSIRPFGGHQFGLLNYLKKKTHNFDILNRKYVMSYLYY